MFRILILLSVLLAAQSASAQPIESRSHFVEVISNVPAIQGKTVRLYLRERGTAQVLRRGARKGVVLFVHGAGTPAEVSFDVPFEDYSWMGYLAAAGYDVFSVDMTGYGRSDRPAPMSDRCNLSAEQQKNFGISCPQAYPGALTNITSDWHDIDAAVTFIRTLRHVDKISLIGWSQGGPRAGGWTALHPEQVARLVLLAPAYTRGIPADTPLLPVAGAVFNAQSHEDFVKNWDRQAPCTGEYDPRAADTIWSAMLQSDPVGAGWMPAVRRAPNASSGWGWTTERVKATTVPVLLASGENDKQVDPRRVQELYDDLGSTHKVLLTLGCASHNAMWEKNHALLFKASLDWLDHGTAAGRAHGTLKLGE